MNAGALRLPLMDAGAAVQVQAAADVSGYAHLAVLMTGTGTITGGTVVITEAPTANYAGDWAPILILDPDDVTGNITQGYALPDGAYAFVRGEITETVTGGGTIALLLVAN